jgi:2,4-dienoyl-CoA reductase-like NADH-dependent reductase (Old Yellow Enzyme family)
MGEHMANLFESTNIKNLNLKNRFIRSATWEGMADECGACTPELVTFFARLPKAKSV